MKLIQDIKSAFKIYKKRTNRLVFFFFYLRLWSHEDGQHNKMTCQLGADDRPRPSPNCVHSYGLFLVHVPRHILLLLQIVILSVLACPGGSFGAKASPQQIHKILIKSSHFETSLVIQIASQAPCKKKKKKGKKNPGHADVYGWNL